MPQTVAFAILALGWILGAEASAQPYAAGGARIAAIVARVTPEAPPWLARADLALARRQAAPAREALERAETALLNARLRGERGLIRAIAAMATAREAMDRGDQPGARAAIQPMLVSGAPA